MAALNRSGRASERPPHPRYRARLRRAVPALVMILGLSAVAGVVWLRVLDRVEAGTAAAAACRSAPAGAPASTRVQVRVFNSSPREGLARTVAAQLRSRGFGVLSAANDPLMDVREVKGPAEVRFGPAGAKQAELLRRQVPGATLYRDVREDTVVDLALGPRFRRLATAAELTKRRQGVVAAPPSAPAGC
jgi:hypothetical protein